MDNKFRTIVGGRSTDHRDRNNFPRGIEILLKKAKVDNQFRALLLKNPIEAAKSIDLDLNDNEKKIVESTSKFMLERMVKNIFVPKHHVKTFATSNVAAMLALVLASTALIPTHAGAERGNGAEAIEYEDDFQVAEEKMGVIQEVLEQYKLDHGTYLSTEEWLSESNPFDKYLPHSYLYDPWERKFHYEAVLEEDRIVSYKLESFGEDIHNVYDNIACPIDAEDHSF